MSPTISKTGKRQRLFYESLDEAKNAATRLKKRHAQFGLSLRSLTSSRMGEAAEAFNLLDAHSKTTGDDATLLGITKDYIARYNYGISPSLSGYYQRTGSGILADLASLLEPF